MLPHDDFVSVRRILIIDAITCAACGALMAFAADPLAALTQLPEPLLAIAGVALFPVAALFGWMALSRTFRRSLLLIAVLGNAGWVAGCLATLSVTSPSALGQAFVLAQAAAVGVLAVLEARGLKAPLGLAAG